MKHGSIASLAVQHQKSMKQRGAEALLRRILFVFLGVVVFRIGIFIPIPGVDIKAYTEYFRQIQESGSLLQGLSGYLGSNLSHASIFLLGLSPYILSSIFMRFVTIAFPSIKAMQSESGAGRQRVNQYMRYGTAGLAFVSSILSVAFFSGHLSYFMSADSLQPGALLVIPGDSLMIYLLMVPCLVAGSVFLMWLGEQMSEYGVGNGSSILICAGLISKIPANIFGMLEDLRQGTLSPLPLLFWLIYFSALVYITVFLELTHRKIPIHYADRPDRMRLIQAPAPSLPLKFNLADVMPAYFAENIFLFIGLISRVSILRGLAGYLQVGPVQLILKGALLVMAAFIYAGINFDPFETAERLKKDKAFILGLRPGIQTAHYLQGVAERITLLAAVYLLSLVCILPEIAAKIWRHRIAAAGTGLVIVVGIIIELVEHITTHIYVHRYESVLKRTNFWKLRDM